MSDTPVFTSQRMAVKIANSTLRVPVCVDERTTQTLAEAVTKRFKSIEEAAGRIDTQAFALQTAYEFAAQLHMLRQHAAEDERTLTVALDTIAERLATLINDFQRED